MIRVARLLIVLLVAVVAMVKSRVALADEAKILNVAFHVGLEERPTHICVVASDILDGKAVALNDLAGIRATDSKKPTMWRIELDPTKRAATEAKIKKGHGKWQSKALNQAKLTDEELRVLDALEAMSAAPAKAEQNGTCSSMPPICKAQFEVPPDDDNNKVYQNISCVKNDQRQPGSELRVAVLRIEGSFYKRLGAGSPGATQSVALTDLRLNGNLAQLTLNEAIRQFDHISVMVVGGHYALGDGGYSAGARLDLPLLLRCRLHEIRAPVFATTESTKVKVEVGLPTGDKIECKDPRIDRGQFAMYLPYLIGEREVQRTVDVDVGKLGEPGYAHFFGGWTGVIPPPVVNLKADAVSFSWRVHCLHGWRATDVVFTCPEATLVDAGVPCKPRPNLKQRTCDYVCDWRVAHPYNSDAGMRFDLPTRVRFQRGSTGREPFDEAWDEQLTRGNQELSGYVAPEWRHIRLDLGAWGVFPKGAVRRVEVISAAGKSHVVGYDEKAESVGVSIPNVGCQDKLTYQIYGYHIHEPVDKALEQGVLTLDHPADTAKHFSTRGALGLGFFTPHAINGRNTGTIPHAVGRLDLSWRPELSSWGYALQIGVLTSQQPYVPISDSGRASVIGKAWFNRYFVGEAITFELSDRAYVGGSLWLLAGHAVVPDEVAKVGHLRVDGALSVFVGGYTKVDLFAIELGLRWLMADRATVITTDYRGTLRAEQVYRRSLLVDLSGRFGSR